MVLSPSLEASTEVAAGKNIIVEAIKHKEKWWKKKGYAPFFENAGTTTTEAIATKGVRHKSTKASAPSSTSTLQQLLNDLVPNAKACLKLLMGFAPKRVRKSC